MQIIGHENDDYNGDYAIDTPWNDYPHFLLDDADAGKSAHLYFFDDPAGDNCWKICDDCFDAGT